MGQLLQLSDISVLTLILLGYENTFFAQRKQK